MKVVISKSKNAESIYISKSYRIGNKTTSKTIKKLGSMQELLPLHNNSREEVISWAHCQALILTKKEKEDSRDIIIKCSQSKQIGKDNQRCFNGGYLFLQNIFHELQLDTICNDISSRYHFDFNLTDILAKLLYTRILFPSSKLSSFESSKKFIEQPSFDSHQIYRALDVLAKEKECIERSVYKNSTSIIDRNTSVLYYDCTNYFFEIEEANGLKQYGKSKEHRPNPIIQMGLLMDGDGVPLSFCINPGNQNEQQSLKPIEKQIMKDFKLSQFIVCTDAGLASYDNRKFNTKGKRSYIVTQSLKQLKGHLQQWALDPNGWHLPNSDETININDINEDIDKIYYKERWINENGLEQRFIVSYSPKYKVYQRSIRSKQMGRAKTMVEKQNVINQRNQNSPKRFIEETKTTPQGEVAKETYITLNQEAIDKEEQYDGFYGVCTTLEDPIEQILAINARRWEIEESFRIMKTEFSARPVYLQKDERIIAHFLTCFLSLLIYRILEKKLDEKYSSEKMIQTMKDMNFYEVAGEGYIPIYTRTDITDSLHEVFQFRTDTQIVSNKNMKKIIKSTKK